MIRARKQKKLALASMRRSCNRALYDETTTSLDYDVIWLDDYAGQLVTPKDHPISVFTVCKILFDYIQESPALDRVSSRDAGRYLKFLRIGPMNVGEQVKNYGGLKMFISILSNIFITADNTLAPCDPNDTSYWIGLNPRAEVGLLVESKQATLTPAEKQFFDDTYSLVTLLENKERVYAHTLSLLRQDSNIPTARPRNVHQDDNSDTPPVQHSEDLKRDYSALTVSQLKEICRERGLPISGVKAALLERIERIEAGVRKETGALEATKMQQPTQIGLPPSVPDDVAKYLEDLGT